MLEVNLLGHRKRILASLKDVKEPVRNEQPVRADVNTRTEMLSYQIVSPPLLVL